MLNLPNSHLFLIYFKIIFHLYYNFVFFMNAFIEQSDLHQ